GSDGFKPVEQLHRDLLIFASRFHSGTRSLSASRRPILSQRRRSSKPFLPPFSIASPYAVIFATFLFANSPRFLIVKQLTIQPPLGILSPERSLNDSQFFLTSVRH